jgi:hypothetical protein
MAANEIHLGDIGTVFEVTLKDGDAIVDVSTATAKTIYFLKPNGTTLVAKSADFKSDGSDGIIQYTTVANDLDELGKWKIQARVILPTGTWSSDLDTFKVHDNLPGVVMPS